MKYPSSIKESANGLQKIGSDQRAENDWYVGMVAKTGRRTEDVQLVKCQSGVPCKGNSPRTKKRKTTERAERNAAATIVCQERRYVNVAYVEKL